MGQDLSVTLETHQSRSSRAAITKAHLRPVSTNPVLLKDIVKLLQMVRVQIVVILYEINIVFIGPIGLRIIPISRMSCDFILQRLTLAFYFLTDSSTFRWGMDCCTC
jgi:hypothetical protein